MIGVHYTSDQNDEFHHLLCRDDPLNKWGEWISDKCLVQAGNQYLSQSVEQIGETINNLTHYLTADAAAVEDDENKPDQMEISWSDLYESEPAEQGGAEDKEELCASFHDALEEEELHSMSNIDWKELSSTVAAYYGTSTSEPEHLAYMEYLKACKPWP